MYLMYLILKHTLRKICIYMKKKTNGWTDHFQFYSLNLDGTLFCKSFKNFWKLIFQSELVVDYLFKNLNHRNFSCLSLISMLIFVDLINLVNTFKTPFDW